MVLAGDPTLVGDIAAVEAFAANTAAPIAYIASNLNSAAIGTTTTGILTLPSTTYKAGRAYQVHVGGAFTMSTTTSNALWDLWKTSTAGTQVLSFLRTPVPGVTQSTHLALMSYMAVGAADVTAQLVLAVAASAGATVTHIGSASAPRFVLARDVGPASAYPNAPLLT